MNPTLNSALMYAHLNFKVFPLKVNSKNGQVLKSWLKEATTDIEKIQNWFSNTDYNVGVRTGDGLVVIDIDNKNDKNGIKSIKPFLKDFPKTKIVKTANNGWHMYYKVDRQIPNKTNLYEGIDVRGERGYVVGIGSVIDGNSYFVSLDDPIADANNAVYKFLEGNKISTANKLEIENIIEQGKRNDILFRLGCSLQSKGVSDEMIKKCLINENIKRCKPPLLDKEVNTIIQSVINRYDKPKYEKDNEYQVTWKSALQMSQSPKVECTDVIESLLPIGVTLLAAPSKMGKTFLCMQMANAIAKGSEFLDFKCKKRNVYYIALEDPENNQIDRLKNTINEVAEGYDIELTQPYQLDFNLEQKIINYKHFHPNLGVVIIDTFEKIRTNADRTYTIEYKE
ncbi:MAG: bifunctional DNA primase/polymerase [Beduini sp.]|uniref:bifunctional DNA primase/polymerase n=1 Tax=Beduini sp. TaxID=1922300 RepID=UPI0039A14D4E